MVIYHNETTRSTPQTLYYLIACAAIADIWRVWLFTIEAFPVILIFWISYGEIIFIIAGFSLVALWGLLRVLVHLIELLHSNCYDDIVNVRLSGAVTNLDLFTTGLATFWNLIFILTWCTFRFILDFVDIIFIDIGTWVSREKVVLNFETIQ